MIIIFRIDIFIFIIMADNQ